MIVKRLTIFYLLFLSANFLSAQQSKIDSLLVLNKLARQDIDKVKILTQLAQSHENSDSSIFYAQMGIKLAQKIDFQLGEAQASMAIAQTFGDSGDEIKALEFYQRSLEINRLLENEEGTMMALEGYAPLYFLLNDYRQELLFHQKAERIARKLGATKQLVPILGNIGKTYIELGVLDSARISLLEAEDIIRNSSIPDYFTAYILSQLSDLMSIEGKNAEALAYNHRSLRLWKEGNDKHRIAENYISLSNLFVKLDRVDSIIYYSDKALELASIIPDSLEIIEAASENLSTVYEKQNDYKKALQYSKAKIAAQAGIYNHEKTNKLSAIVFREKQRTQELIAAEKALQGRILLYTTLAGFSICLIIVFILYFNNKQKQKAKLKIEQAYSDLKSTQFQLIQSEKMASLGELTAGIAHEIQNPLNFVNNFSEVSTELVDEMNVEIDKGNVKDAKEIANDLKQNLEKINHHGKRAGDIIKGMLQHSRSSSGVKEPTNINALADEYLRLAYHGLRAKDKTFNATMKTDFDESIGKINIIPQDIGRVILNLITNAFYVVNERQKLLATSHEPLANYEPTVTVSTKKEGNKVLISVKDNGNGIPQKIIDKIFQPFFTTKPTGQGTGLGLSLSYDIVKAHGGELKVETLSAEAAAQAGNEGVGSTFIVQLPVV
jgi:two-component system, NtrC family, sensor kinase